MDDRRVTATGKDRDGDITRLCNAGSLWSPRSKEHVIRDIENRAHTYYVMDAQGRRADIHVAGTVLTKKYLRTDPDSSCSNNLDNLPDC